MAINTNGVASTLQRPAVAFSISSIIEAQQNTQDFAAIGLCEKTNSGNAVYKKIYTVTSEEMAIALFGKNSAGHCFYSNYNANHNVAIAMMAVEEATGKKASLSVNFKTNALKGGLLVVRILGKEVSIYINSNETKEEVALKFYNKLTTLTHLPIVIQPINASNASLVEVVSAHNSVSLKNISYEIEVNESGCEIEAKQTEGSGKASLINSLDAIGEKVYDFIALPYVDKTILEDVRDWLEERHMPLTALDGHCIAITHVNFANAETYNHKIESKNITLFPMQSESPEVAMLAALTAQIAASSVNNSALPFQTLPLKGIVPNEKIFSNIERDVLLANKISTVQKNNERLAIERVLTFAQLNNPSSDLCDKLSITFFRRMLTRQLQLKYPRYNISANENVSAPSTITLNTVKAEVIQFYRKCEEEGLMQDSNYFEKNLKIEKEGDRINFVLPIKTASQLRQIIGTILGRGN